MGTLNTFLSIFKDGFVQSNLFRVYITAGGAVGYEDILSAACKSATIPGTTFTENKFYHDGVFNKFVSGADYDPFTLIFMVDQGETRSKIIDCFEEWGNLIYKDGKYGYKDNYKCDIKFEILNKKGKAIYITEVIDAYPTNISAFDLSFDSDNQFLEYPISFNFLKFKSGKS